MSCTGPCAQGRKRCPLPAACHLAEPGRYDNDGRSMLRWLLVGVTVVLPCVLLGVHFVFVAIAGATP